MKLAQSQRTGLPIPRAFERDTLAEIGMPKEMVMRHRLPQFNHLFSSATAIQLAITAISGPKRWMPTLGRRLPKRAMSGTRRPQSVSVRCYLATGNETDRIEAYRAFRGRDPDVKYIMKKRGFPTGN